VAIYVLIRFDFFVFQANLPGHQMQFSLFLLPLALLGILVASAVAVYEGHLKRLFATSSVAQIGYIMLGASFLSESGLTASGAHLFNHALAKGGLFLAVACLACQYRDLRLDQLAGAAKTMPWTAAAMVVCGFSLIGVPGTAGFISKWLLISAALEQNGYGWFLVVVILVSSLMALAYVWRVVETIYFKPAVVEAEGPGEAPLSLLLVTLAVALANIFFGFFPQFPLTLSSAAAELLLRHNL
jgi:multicomponent Na+:H+ antiporter subunit D